MKIFLPILLFITFLAIIFGVLPEEVRDFLAFFSLGYCLGNICQAITDAIL